MCADIEADYIPAGLGRPQDPLSKTVHFDCFVVGIHDVEIYGSRATCEGADGRPNRDIASPKLRMHAPDEIMVSIHYTGCQAKTIVER